MESLLELQGGSALWDLLLTLLHPRSFSCSQLAGQRNPRSVEVAMDARGGEDLHSFSLF